jgi:hypothetical protein
MGELTWRKKAILAGVALAALAAAFVAGLYSRPARVETVTKVETKTVTETQWRDRIVYVQSKDTARHVVTHVEKKPDGTVTTTKTEDVKVDQDTGINADSSGEQHQEQQTSAEAKTVTIYERSRFAAEARCAWRPGEAPRFDGAEIQVRALGPFWIGAGIEKTDKLRATASVRAEF